MNWKTSYARLQQLQNVDLESISGKTNIRLMSLDEATYVVLRQDGKPVLRNTSELKKLVELMNLNQPIHVETELHGGGSSRSHPETLLANLADVECRRVNSRKNIVWVGQDTHPAGTLRKT